jgi:ABC-type phosphate transport system substrate-binding protein
MNMKRLIVVIVFIVAGAPIAAAQIAVIAHKEAPVDTLTPAQVLDFYSGDLKIWSNKVPVTLFDLKAQSESKEAFYKLLGKTPSRMKSLWLKKLLMGEGEPPAALPSEEEMLRKVASTRGALGFVSQTKVTKEVKVIVIVAKKEKS